MARFPIKPAGLDAKTKSSSSGGGGSAGVSTFNTRSGAVTLNKADVTGTGLAAADINAAALASPTFTGTPAAPTAANGTTTTQLATTAFVAAAVTAGTAGVSSFNTRTGAVSLSKADVTGTGLAAADISAAGLASPAFTGTPTAPTTATSDSSTTLATTALVAAKIAAAGTGGSGASEKAYAEITANFSTGSSSFVDTGLAVTFTPTSGPVLVTCSGSMFISGSGTTGDVRLFDQTNSVQLDEQLLSVLGSTGEQMSFMLRRRKVLTAGTAVTWKVQLATTSGTVTIQAAATQPVGLQVIQY